MATKPRAIVIDPDSELSGILEVADDGPVLLDRSGKHYRLERIEEPTVVAPASADEVWVGYDPMALRCALAESAGSWADVDVDELLAELYRSRDFSYKHSERLYDGRNSEIDRRRTR